MKNKNLFDGFTVNIFFDDEEGYYHAQLMEFPTVSAFGLTPAAAVRQLKTDWKLMKERLKEREKQHTIFVLEFFKDEETVYEYRQPPHIEALSEQALLEVFCDETSSPIVKYRAAMILLTVKKCTKFVPICMEFLNFIINAELDIEDFETWMDLNNFPDLFLDLALIRAYPEVKDFVNYLLTENPRHKKLFFNLAIMSLASLSVKLNRRDAIPILKSNMSHFGHFPKPLLIEMAEYFDKFKEVAGIQGILTNGLADKMPDVETRCLELLQKHDPEFVKEWQAQKETANTQNEASE